MTPAGLGPPGRAAAGFDGVATYNLLSFPPIPTTFSHQQGLPGPIFIYLISTRFSHFRLGLLLQREPLGEGS